MSRKLRFAALIRASTDRQADEGESLSVQRERILKDVETLGGTIVECYGGSEHASPGHEKKEIARLLDDAKHKRFDAEIAHLCREIQDGWSEAERVERMRFDRRPIPWEAPEVAEPRP